MILYWFCNIRQTRMPVRGRLGALGMHLDRQPSSKSAKRTICRTLGSEPVRTIWDYVYRRFGITKSENTRNTMGPKLPQLSDLISLDACRSKIMLHLAATQVTPLFKMVHREFHTLRRIYRLLKTFRIYVLPGVDQAFP